MVDKRILMAEEKNDIVELYRFVCGQKKINAKRNLSNETMLKEIKACIRDSRQLCVSQNQELDRINNRLNEILTVIQKIASLQFDTSVKIDGKNDQLDALSSGINMMAEELHTSTVSLSEKELLLNEVHHRVKNNLQLVVSLLNIQSSFISDTVALEKFRETQNRVNSMALIHEKLYTSNDFSKINFGEYLLSITSYLNYVYNINPERIKLKIDIKKDAGFLPLDTALPCGLIVNELLSNSFKYAFPNNKKGLIVFTLSYEKIKNKRHYLMSLKDNGVGFNQKIKLEDTPSLGLQIVNTLVDQIDGKISMQSSTKGTTFTIAFKQ